MVEKYDALYLSPHLDDVALSCGGQIWQRTEAGERVLVVTLAAGEPAADAPLSEFAAWLHEQWQLSGGVAAARRQEDEAAMALLGADARYWDLPDCVYRFEPEEGRPFYPSVEAIFGPVDPAENALVARLAKQMAALPPAREVIGPLGAGNHVDHQLTRDAAEAAFGERLLYYEDFPYVSRDPWAAAGLLARRRAWELAIIPLTEKAVARRQKAVAAYLSQIPILFGDEAATRTAISDYVTRVGGERLWRQLS